MTCINNDKTSKFKKSPDIFLEYCWCSTSEISCLLLGRHSVKCRARMCEAFRSTKEINVILMCVFKHIHCK